MASGHLSCKTKYSKYCSHPMSHKIHKSMQMCRNACTCFLSKLLGCFKVATFLEILRFCVAFQLPKDQNFGLFITWCVLVGFGLFQSVERRECCVVYEQVFFLRGALTWAVSKYTKMIMLCCLWASVLVKIIRGLKLTVFSPSAPARGLQCRHKAGT